MAPSRRQSFLKRACLFYSWSESEVAIDGDNLKQSVNVDVDDDDVQIEVSSDSGFPRKRRLVGSNALGGNCGSQACVDPFLPGLPDDAAFICLAKTSRKYYVVLSSVNRRFNSLVCSGYLYQLRRQLDVSEQWVYLALDPTSWVAYDPSVNKWMSLPKLPCDECFAHADKESLAVGTNVLVFGLEIFGFAIWMYSLVTNSWTKVRGMNFPRCLFASSSYGKLAVIAGGSDKNGHSLRCAELYDSETGVWEVLPDMHVPRRSSSGFFMDGKFYVIGGMRSLTEPLTCGEVFDLETRTWNLIPNMYPSPNRPSGAPPLVAVVNNQLYAADQATNEVKKYDKVNNIWTVLGSLPLRADFNYGWGLAFRSCNDKLLVIGGQNKIVIHKWCPKETAQLQWDVLSNKELCGVFVYNCAVMSC